MGRDIEKRKAWSRERGRKLAPQRKERYDAAKLAKICPNCKKRIPTEGTLLCEKCAETRRRVSKNYYARARRDAFATYGGMECSCCGETEEMFLSIDHVNSDGAEHRRAIANQGGSNNFYVWLKRNNYPKGFQVLCMNCNHGRHRNGGACPHKEKKLSIQCA